MRLYNIHTHHLPGIDEQVILNKSIGVDSLNLSEKANCYYSVGIHPWDVKNIDFQQSHKQLYESALLPNVVAIGECGLDKRCQTSLTDQLPFFMANAHIAEERALPLLIHCVKAWDELIAAHKELRPQQAWIIHGFRGNAILAAQLIRQGFFLSFGEHFHPEALSVAWPDRLFIETDESLLSLHTIYAQISTALNIPLTQLIQQIEQNISSIHLTL